MQTRIKQSGQTLSAEDHSLRRQEDEELGRVAWAKSTRSGLNLSAPTTADLRALGAKVRAVVVEGAMTADAAVRAAADTATFGLADEMSAGANALIGAGGEGTLAERYGRLHAQEQAIDEFNREHRPIATAAGELGMAALTFKGSASAASKALSRLPTGVKGKIGERMSDVRTILSADVPVKHGKRLNLNGGGHTFTDHQTARGKIVEAKLGPKAKLSPRQRQAQAEFGPRYRHDNWSFDDVGRVVGGAVVGTQDGIGRISDHVQDTLFGRQRR